MMGVPGKLQEDPVEVVSSGTLAHDQFQSKGHLCD